MIRASCGTLAGALAHAEAGERQCGWCAQGEAVARLEAERVPRRQPAADPVFRPLTAAQAERNAAVLAAEAQAYERDHPVAGNGDHHRAEALRVIQGGAA